LGDSVSKGTSGGALHLLEHEGAHLGGGVLLVVPRPRIAAGMADDLVGHVQALGGEEGGGCDGTLGNTAHHLSFRFLLK